MVARLKPVIPDELWPFLLTVRSFRGGGPIVGLPAFRRVLVVSAHPDDESIGCAGTLSLLADAGAQIRIVVATDGEATKGSTLHREETGQMRRAEMTEVASLLGAHVTFLGFPDGELGAPIDDLAKELARHIDDQSPEAVFAPWLLDDHPDHQAVAAALAVVLSSSGCKPEVWGYETWAALVPNRIVDISTRIDRKQEVLALHRTATLAFDLSAGVGLNRWRSVHGLMGRGHAEAFLAIPADRYVTFADEVRETQATSQQ